MLSKLLWQYRAKTKEMKKLKNQPQKGAPILENLHRDLKKLNEQLLHTSFGLEHLFREFGQMYESVCDVLKWNKRRQISE